MACIPSITGTFKCVCVRVRVRVCACVFVYVCLYVLLAEVFCEPEVILV